MAAREICFKELFDAFEVSAKEWLDKIPEARGLTLIVDWGVGKNDFPPAFQINRGAPTEESVLACMQQGIKFIELLSAMHREQVASDESIVKRAQAIVDQANANNKQTG